jgi:hypothetical protein
MRNSIQGILESLVNGSLISSESMFPVSRAIAYLLTFMILPRHNGAEDPAEILLKKLRDHPDEATRELGKWAIENRIGENGAVRPLVRAGI